MKIDRKGFRKMAPRTVAILAAAATAALDAMTAGESKDLEYRITHIRIAPSCGSWALTGRRNIHASQGPTRRRGR